MAGGQERVLKRRIRTVNSTKKITRAMELIASSRIVKAQQAVAAARPYSEAVTEVIRHLAAGGAELSHPILAGPETQSGRRGLVVVASDRGLAGAYNTNVIRAGERALRDGGGMPTSGSYSLFAVGRKADSYFRFRRYEVAETFVGMSDRPAYAHAKEVAQAVMAAYDSGQLDRVDLAYTQFLSVGTQRPVVRQLLPVEVGAITETAEDHGPQAAYEFEPDPGGILDQLLPRYVESRIYAAMLDAAASEHAARQRAMKSATDNADDLAVRLTRVMNRARQEAITTEIMEIVGGAEAMRQAQSSGGDLLSDRMSNTDLFSDTTADNLRRRSN
ncbi:MAG TPA: F0F1 ATP synthase subunit gamma [Acidimicrobiales bacterium]|nr:F0F1 ATP synthase subunit gamma [Acidimicrobiales bacterium]